MQAKPERKLGLPVILFVGTLLAYGATVAAIIVFPLWWSLVLVPICGILVVMLFVIGHDACHQSFTSSRALNHLIGRVAFVPSMHSYSLWDREHNQRHHRFNNIKGLDYAWIPMDPEEYAAAGAPQRLRYRFYRMPGGVLFYYLIELWAQRNLVPRRSLVGKITPTHVADTVLLVAALLIYLSALIVAGEKFGKNPAEVVTLAFVLPFLIFSALMSAAIFLHHTHYAVPWYRSIKEWKDRNGAVLGTAHVEFPAPFRWLILNIMVHNAHHSAPSVPLYQLPQMQSRLATSEVVTWQFSFSRYFEVCARCKLFDYEKSRWFDFAGCPTSEPLRYASHRPRSPLEPTGQTALISGART